MQPPELEDEEEELDEPEELEDLPLEDDELDEPLLEDELEELLEDVGPQLPSGVRITLQVPLVVHRPRTQPEDVVFFPVKSVVTLGAQSQYLVHSLPQIQE